LSGYATLFNEGKMTGTIVDIGYDRTYIGTFIEGLKYEDG
jgi:hypothetical protein